MDFFSIWHLVILLLIVVVLFGTSKLKNIGTDLGSAIKSFKSAMNDEQAGAGDPKTETSKPNIPAITKQEMEGQAADRIDAEHTDGQKTGD